jgi:hypothetical protein
MADAKIKILFLAANPTNETRLRLGAESTKIKEALQLSSARDQFIFAENHAVRVDSLMRLVLREDPHIVHFSGHGSNEGALIFEDHIGNAMEADPVGIANLFKLAGENTRLIVLNACYSRRQANELATRGCCHRDGQRHPRRDSSCLFHRSLRSFGRTSRRKSLF